MNKRSGLTLVEIMIVVVIIGILAAIAIPRFVASSNDAKTSACDANIHNLNAQWEMYYTNTGTWDSYATFVASTEYFPDGAPTCPYGTAYVDADGNHRVDAHSH